MYKIVFVFKQNHNWKLQSEIITQVHGKLQFLEIWNKDHKDTVTFPQYLTNLKEVFH